jgi:hypothetical protein
MNLATLLDKMPNPTPLEEGKPSTATTVGTLVNPEPDVAEQIYAEILKGGRESLVKLIDRLVEPGKGHDYKVRWLLHGLVMDSGGPDKREQRAMVSGALASQLGPQRPNSVRCFLLEQLKYCATEAVAEPVGRLLLDEDRSLSEHAAEVLMALGGEGAAVSLRRALANASKERRLMMIHALGRLRDGKSVPALEAALGDPDQQTRLAAAFALAAVAEPGAAGPLLKAAGADAVYEQDQMAAACLELAVSLLQGGRKEQATAIYKALSGPERPAHVRAAAARGLLGTVAPEM